MKTWPLQKSQATEVIIFTFLLGSIMTVRILLASNGNDNIRAQSEHHKELQIDLNQADTNSLKKLPGIGSTFAKRIIKYRKLLGGYVSKDQILEVYGLPAETYDKISIFIETPNTLNHIKRIDLNQNSFKEILRHPYIDYEQTKAIFKLRNNDTVRFSQIIEHQIFDSLQWIKLKPYLKEY